MYRSARASSHIDEAKDFCQQLVPRLDAARRANGAYPPTLDEILLPGEPLPSLLRRPENAEWYSPSGDHYRFYIYCGGRLVLCAPLTVFDSRTATWEVSTG